MAGASTVSVPLGDADNVEFRGGSLHVSRDRDRTHSSSSSKSVVSQDPNIVTSECTAKNLFAFKVSRSDNRFGPVHRYHTGVMTLCTELFLFKFQSETSESS